MSDARQQAEVFMDEGNTALSLGEPDAAIEAFKKAADTDPTFIDAWQAVCMVQVKLKNFPAAIEAGLKVIEIDPNDVTGYTSLSIAYMRNNQIQEAEAMSAKARILSWGGKIKKD
jgi:tetratricopeptide (TPR) repeat protein